MDHYGGGSDITCAQLAEVLPLPEVHHYIGSGDTANEIAYGYYANDQQQGGQSTSSKSTLDCIGTRGIYYREKKVLSMLANFSFHFSCYKL